jgi:hypothetical protein
LDAFSNAFVPWETMVTSQLPLNPDVAQQIPFDTLHSLGSLYFCVPGNEKLDDLWDTVADRLFKIRHCMNLDGVERSLPLFEPPIDPALLVKAAAAGLDIAAVLSDIEAPLPLYRTSRCALLGDPTIAFLATDKVIGHLLGGFASGDSNTIPPSFFVIDEDMRSGTLNSRLSFESYSSAAGRVSNRSTHRYFAAALMALSNWWKDRLHRLRTSRLIASSDISVAGESMPVPNLSAIGS